MRRTAVGILLVIGGLFAWYAAANALLIAICGLQDQLDAPWRAYYDYAMRGPEQFSLLIYGGRFIHVSIKLLLAAAGTLPVIVTVLILVIVWKAAVARNFRRRFVRWPWQATPIPERRAVTDHHGHAEWMTEPEALATFGTPAFGKVVGRLPSGALLRDDCTMLNGVSLEFAAPGGGKTSAAITTVAAWRGPVVVHDPKCEMAPMMWRMLEGRGRRVIIVSPEPSPHDPDTGQLRPWAHLVHSFNALDWIDPHNPLYGMHIAAVAAWFFDDHVAKTDSGTFFRDSAKSLIECVLAHILLAGPGGPPPTLATLCEVISSDMENLRAFLAGVRAGSPSRLARRLAGPLAGEPEKTFGNIHGEASAAVKWLATESLSDMVSGDGFRRFRTRDLVDEEAVIFLQIPLNALLHSTGVAKVVVGAFLNMVIGEDGIAPWTLFLIDEAWMLGQMTALKTALFAARSYHVALHMMWQSVGQMEEVWKREGVKFWIDSATWAAYSSIHDIEVSRRISDTMGTYGVIARSEGDNTGSQARWGSSSRGRNTNFHEIKRAIKMPHEVISDFARHDLIVLGLAKPLLLRRALWWWERELVHSIEVSRFQLQGAG